ncbi:MAG: hypothetical protein HUU21_17185, partial [Polyangiaceae bacterium]|nr:hypothetical protein [Polyangiaceae bacterium]
MVPLDTARPSDPLSPAEREELLNAPRPRRDLPLVAAGEAPRRRLPLAAEARDLD